MGVPQLWREVPQINEIRLHMSKLWSAYLNNQLFTSMLDNYEKHQLVSANFFKLWYKVADRYNDSIQCNRHETPEKIILSTFCLGKNISKNDGLKNEWFYIRQAHFLSINVLKYFKMNITFLIFNLSSAQQCYGYDVNDTTVIEFVKFLLHQSTETYVMCGRYPSHSLYTNSTGAGIKAVIWPPYGSSLSIQYQLFDSNLIKSFTIDKYYRRFDIKRVTMLTQDLVMQITMPPVIINIFRIITLKIYILKIKRLKLHAYSLRVFNGPDVLCRELFFINVDENIQQVITGSYQALIVDNSVLLFTPDLNINISMHIPKYHTVTELGNFPLTFSLANNSCLITDIVSCMTKVKLPPTLQAKITFNEVLYVGPDILTNLCLYGSVNIYFRDGTGTFKIVAEYCQDVSSLDANSMRIPPITTTNDTEEIWISLISYLQYSSIAANISMIRDNCIGFICDHYNEIECYFDR